VEKIVFVGDKPARYFKLPHPSGNNLKANPSEELDNLLKECSEWLKQR
jgi:hypothetical protein